MSPSALPDPMSWTELLRVFGGLVAVIAVFVAVVGSGILAVGFLFNLLFAWATGLLAGRAMASEQG